MRLAKISAKDDMTQTLTRRIWWAWSGFAFCWFALALWLFYAIMRRRHHRTAAHDRKRAVEAMEQANASKRKFLSMVNHEVRSPLQSIVASAEFLAMKDSRPDSASAIRRIRHALTVLQGQLRDLLTIAPGDAAQLPTQVETFELGELVQDVCAGLKEAAIAKGLAFQVEFPPSPVTGSACLMRRIALGVTRLLRFMADTYFANRYGHRAIVLETVAAVPGMVGEMATHLQPLCRTIPLLTGPAAR